MDVKLEDFEAKIKFKVRVNGILMNNGKMLILRMNNVLPYCCPGGHVMMGEDSMTAMKREFEEETGIKVEIEKLIAIIENFFNSKDVECHEISFYYLLKANEFKDNKDKDFSLIENDKGKLKNMEYKWIDPVDVDKYNFQPTILHDKLKKKDFTFSHIIFKDF